MLSTLWCSDCGWIDGQSRLPMSRLADTNNTVLIVSNDATGAALLGGLVETLGYRVRFAAADDARAAGRRLRPRVALLDCETDCDESAVAHVLMRGIAVVLVGPQSVLTRMQDLAAHYGAEIAFMPPEPGPLGDVIDRAVRRSAP
jgi:hypothetical protein